MVNQSGNSPLGTGCNSLYNFQGFNLSFLFESNSSWQNDLSSLCGDNNPFSFNPDSAEFDVTKGPVGMSVVIIIYSIVIIMGGLGNILVVVTVAKTKQMWSATNIFIANLALCDVCVCVFDLPLTVYYQLTDDWIFGEILCHMIMSFFGFVVYASTLTLTVIAIDRYILIVYPHKNKMSCKVALVLVVVIAIISMGIASPIAIYSTYLEVRHPDIDFYRKYCAEQWPSAEIRHLYSVLTLVFHYFVPLLLIGVLYFLIFDKLKVRLQSGNSRKTKTTKMLVAVVAVFALTWTPFHIFSIVGDFKPAAVSSRYYKLTDALLRALALSSSCINPILYGWLNDNYRNAFRSLLRRPHATPRGIHCEESMAEVSKRRPSAHEAIKRYINKSMAPNKNRRRESEIRLNSSEVSVQISKDQQNHNSHNHSNSSKAPLLMPEKENAANV